jgi:hypothetical protein
MVCGNYLYENSIYLHNRHRSDLVPGNFSPDMPNRRTVPANPILLLRQQLGKPGKLLSSQKLSPLVGMPDTSLRALELGKRDLSQETIARLRRAGATWNSQAGEWRFTYDLGERLRLEHLELLQKFSAGSAWFRDRDRRALCLRVLALIDAVPRDSYNSLLLDLHESLENLKARYDVKGATKEFEQTQLRYGMGESESGGLAFEKGYPNLPLPVLNKMLDFNERSEYLPQMKAEDAEYAARHPEPADSELDRADRVPRAKEKKRIYK